MYVLLYADDTIELAETRVVLQSTLYTNKMYCRRWKLTVYFDKSNLFLKILKSSVRVMNNLSFFSQEISENHMRFY